MEDLIESVHICTYGICGGQGKRNTIEMVCVKRQKGILHYLAEMNAILTGTPQHRETKEKTERQDLQE